MRAHQSWIAALLVAGALSACGGGDGGSAPAPAPVPLASSPYALKADQSEADGLASAVTRASTKTLRAGRDLDALDLVFRLTRFLQPHVFTDSNANSTSVGVDCGRLRALGPALCSGSLRFDLNKPSQNADNVSAGTLIALQFDRFQIIGLDFNRLVVNGGFRIDYVSDFRTQPNIGALSFSSTGLSTNQEGTVIEPTQGTLRVQYGADQLIIETDTERFVNLNTSSTGNGDGTVRSGTTRTNYGGGYVDIAYANWPLAGAAPQPGATATITDQAGTVAQIRVDSVNATTIDYTVTIGGTAYRVSRPRS